MVVASTLRRNRALYLFLALCVIALGLASRKFPSLFPSTLGKYPGDSLWALMVFLLVGIGVSQWPTLKVAAVALTLSFAVEFLQLYQAPWITSIRETTIGHLVLGSHFHATDLLAYAIGVATGFLVEYFYVKLLRS